MKRLALLLLLASPASAADWPVAFLSFPRTTGVFAALQLQLGNEAKIDSVIAEAQAARAALQ